MSWGFMVSTLVCGETLSRQKPDTLQLLQKLGLVHLFVLSGLHVLFLDSVLRKLPFLLRGFLLFLYGQLTLWSTPLLRAFLAFLFFELNKRQRLFWSTYDVITLSGFLCLLLKPSSLTSLSLPLSWTAALGMYIGSRSKTYGFQKHFIIYVCLFPLLLPLGPAHPLSTLFEHFFECSFVLDFFTSQCYGFSAS